MVSRRSSDRYRLSAHKEKDTQREVKIGKYFIDFVIDKIALEIDGRQHDDRKEKDLEKDVFLTDNGFKVVRVKWENGINFRERLIEKMAL